MHRHLEIRGVHSIGVYWGPFIICNYIRVYFVPLCAFIIIIFIKYYILYICYWGNYSGEVTATSGRG